MTPNSHSSSPTPARAGTTYPRSPEKQLFFRTRRRGDTVVLSARGQADAYTLSWWRRAVDEAAETAAAEGGALIVDATRLEFLSLRTLAALGEDAERYRGDGVEVCLVVADQRLARAAATHPLLAYLSVSSTVVGALTSLHGQRQSRPRPMRAHTYRAPLIIPDRSDPKPIRSLDELAQQN